MVFDRAPAQWPLCRFRSSRKPAPPALGGTRGPGSQMTIGPALPLLQSPATRGGEKAQAPHLPARPRGRSRRHDRRGVLSDSAFRPFAAKNGAGCRDGGRTERSRKALRSAAADGFAAAYQSECRPGGPYGALGKNQRPIESAAERNGASVGPKGVRGCLGLSPPKANVPQIGGFPLGHASLSPRHPADAFAAARQSECRPGGPYGALEIPSS